MTDNEPFGLGVFSSAEEASRHIHKRIDEARRLPRRKLTREELRQKERLRKQRKKERKNRKKNRK